MGDILIRGVSMPKGENAYVELQVWGDGKVYKRRGLAGKLVQVGTAVPLPEGHGRIVDAAEVIEKANKSAWFDGDVSELGLLLGSEVTTIVPAEGGTDDVRCL